MSIPDSRVGSAMSPIYNLKDIFMLIPEYDGDPISLNSFLNTCNTAYSICSGDQHIFLIRIKNQLRGRAAQLINSRDLNQWEEISNLLNIHFGDPRDINSLILDLQKLKQLPQENPITFCNRVINLNSKMQSSITKQNLSRDQNLAQSDLIENMTLNTLLTGLEPKIGQIIRASSPNSIVDAVQRIKREMQLSYFEEQRSNIRSQSNSKPSPSRSQKFCNYCRKPGHLISECRTKVRNDSHRQNFGNQQSSNTHQNPFNSRQGQNFNRFNSYNPNPSNSNFKAHQGYPGQFPKPSYQGTSVQRANHISHDVSQPLTSNQPDVTNENFRSTASEPLEPSIYLMAEEQLLYINSHNGKYKFLIDSRASISVIKSYVAENYSTSYTPEQVIIKRITDEEHLITQSIMVPIGPKKIPHKVFICDLPFGLEKICKLTSRNLTDIDAIVHGQEINKVYISHAIVHVDKKGEFLTTVLNSNKTEQTVSFDNLKLEPYTEEISDNLGNRMVDNTFRTFNLSLDKEFQIYKQAKHKPPDIIKEVKTDLFSIPEKYSLAHCV
ncbi:hypothetical protein ABEB36_013722 [Hypothenemus hampei]|uniref:CCHC-type domain-containing protein n=1 Tax=Hypothenemus hampei TaxID=57062 RepID=A0ABD1E532_HYPHA